ncbi:MAG TPA: type II toxin-antitoxin system RelE/ParE family toxin [bacterium]|nr:type II toxin-antitoxin system RelE/ParE family toxin [bacterium]HPQ65846.1 type II toxin-antitoxin system RelE/ParE family toxin [bacterium]
MRTIIFYRTESSRCPVKEFLDSLKAQQARKVVWVLQLVEELDRVPEQYFKKLVSTDDIWEIRVRTGGEIFRLLGFFDGASLIVLNHAFSKKSRKTPAGAINLAENRKRDYLRRKKR